MQSKQTALSSPSTLLLVFMLEWKKKTCWKPRKKICEASTQNETHNSESRFQTLPAADSEYVKHLSLLAQSVRREGVCSYSLEGAMENPILSYVFPWQWGHVVYLTTGLSTEAWWLSDIISLGEITRGQCWARKEEDGDWRLGNDCVVCVQYCTSAADWHVKCKQ